MFWHYPLSKPHFLGRLSGGAIREGDWKLIEKFDTGEIELFNLEKDLSLKKIMFQVVMLKLLIA